jgi:glycosyltransferase involved in cell wall biosynthesis
MSTPSQNSVVAILPAFNEEDRVARVIVRAAPHVQQIVVVDDGSSDYTSRIAEKMGAIVIRHEHNLGKGAALRSGMAFAREKGFNIALTIDSDGQLDANEIPKVIQPVLDGEADVVIGVRSTPGAMPRERVIGNRMLDEATSRKAGVKLEDTQSGFRAYSSRAIASLDFREKGMAVESQTLIDAAHAGLKIVGVPVSTTYEGIRAKRNPVAQFSSVLDYVLSRTVVDSPLLYLGVPGLIALLLGVGAGFWVVSTFLQTHLIAFGTALISAILIITGTIALATALILKFLKVQLAR